MLLELSVHNFALVDKLRVEFDRGFTVLTGETGAGKSIIVGAISTVLGERTSTDVIRSSADRCRVEAVFDIEECDKSRIAAENLGIDLEDHTLIISREISRNGKSTCRVNGQTTTASALRTITDSLIDIHGQHDHQSLLVPAIHIDIYDSWIGNQAIQLRKQTMELDAKLNEARIEKDRLNTNVRERERQVDLLSFQVSDIDSANLIVGEDTELSAMRIKLASAEKLMSGAESVYQILSGDNAVTDSLQSALIACEKMAAIDPGLESLITQLNEVVIGAQDAAARIREYRDEIELDPASLEDVDNRLNLIGTLKRKYGDTIEEILAFRETSFVELSRLQHADELSGELDSTIEKLQSELKIVSEQLSELRLSRKDEFENGVERHLADLAMAGTKFELGITSCVPGSKGMDIIEFMICPNPGEPVKPLSKIASGGEMSRIMLAIKTVCADSGIPTLVFDEIDSGIGGMTGLVLGEKIAALAGTCQVLCVTHLPQVACIADNHMNVAKNVSNGHTSISINRLRTEERVTELARMLGSGEKSDTALVHAREMLSSANKGNHKVR